jgi:hypothetical protein
VQQCSTNNVHRTAAIFGILWTRRNPIEVTSVCYRGTGHEDKMQPRFDFPRERDQQKWNPVLRPIALSDIKRARDLVAKPLTLWRITR